MPKFLKFVGFGCGIPLVLFFFGLVFLATIAPEPSIYVGRDVPARFVDTLKELGVVAEDEQVRYLYSDALFGIEDGVYLLTDRNLSLYVADWDPPAMVLPLETLTHLEVEYDDSFLFDSMAYVEAEDGSSASFPLSSEGGLDSVFVDAVRAAAPQL